MSSVASEISLLPSRTLARTPAMIFSLGMSIWGFRSGTQKLQRRPQPVVISTTPKVVRRSGTSRVLAPRGVDDVDLARQILPANRLVEQRHRIPPIRCGPSTTQSTLRSSKVLGLGDLPAARAAHDDLEILAVRAGLDLLEHQPRVVGIDGLLARAEDRSVNARGERHAQRVVRGDRHHAGAWADELVQVVGIAGDDVSAR